MNNKGFTLVELLTVIIVLAAISLVIVPAVNNSLNNSNEQAYKVQISNIENAAKNWISDNISLIPDNGDEIVVTLGELQDGNYISKELENPKTKSPFPRNTKVIIKNVNESYIYRIVEN